MEKHSLKSSWCRKRHILDQQHFSTKPALQIKIHWNVLQFYLESISVIKQWDLQAQTQLCTRRHDCSLFTHWLRIETCIYLRTATYTLFTWGNVLTLDLVDHVIVLLSNWSLQPHPILQILPSPRYKQSNHTSIYSTLNKLTPWQNAS